MRERPHCGACGRPSDGHCETCGRHLCARHAEAARHPCGELAALLDRAHTLETYAISGDGAWRAPVELRWLASRRSVWYWPRRHLLTAEGVDGLHALLGEALSVAPHAQVAATWAARLLRWPPLAAERVEIELHDGCAATYRVAFGGDRWRDVTSPSAMSERRGRK